MPTYEYHCQSCGKRFEAWQKITDEPIKMCPDCSGEVHRVIYPVGLMFKGSGFYSTDNRGSNASATAANGSGSTPETEKAGTAAEAKPTTSAATTSSSSD
jgi:putative FmdB family regulatory protein